MRVVFYLLWLMLLSVFQPTLARGIEICGIAPNLFLCFVIMIGFYRGHLEGAICGAVFGLVYDLLVGRLIGVSSLLYLYAGLGAGILGAQFFSGGKQLAGSIGTVAATLLTGLLYFLIRKATGSDMGFVTAFFRISLPEAVYNGVVSFLLAFPMRGTMKMLRRRQSY